MEYISHEDYKKMLGSFGKEAPKKALNEMHTMAKQDGPREFHKMPADIEEDLENEGNAFTAGLAKTKKGGEFKVGAKKFTDKTNYDAPIDEEWGSPYDGGADDLAAMAKDAAKDDISKDVHGAAYHIGDKVNYQGHSFTIMIGAGGKAVLKHSSGRILPSEQSMQILKQAAIDKKFGDLDEYQFDQMYPDDPGPFEGKNFMDPDESYFAMAVGDQLNDEAWGLTPEQMDAAEAYLEAHYDDLQGSFANNHEVGGGSTKAARYIVDLIKRGGMSEDIEFNDDEEAREKRAKQAEDDDTEAENSERDDIEERLREFLTKEDDVNWEAVDDNEAEENQTDNGIEEEINLPSSQATGASLEERERPLAHLTSEEREQLKQYVETIKTVKNEISKMVGKAGMEESGDTTGLVMKPTTMSEDGMEQGGDKHEEIEKALGAKHQVIHSAIDKIIQTVKDSGFSEGDAALFLQHEIEEKAKQYATSQYDSN